MNQHVTMSPEIEPLEAIHTVNKIGGANMSKLSEVAKLINTLKGQREHITLVVSAFSGVTNGLVKGLDKLNGVDYDEEVLNQAFAPVKEIHDNIISEFFRAGSESADEFENEAASTYESEFNQLKAALMSHKANYGSNLEPGENTYTIRDQAYAFGELMSAKFLKLYLAKHGHQARHFENISCPEGSFEPGKSTSVSKLHEAMQNGVVEAMNGVAETRDDVINIIGGHIGGTPRGIVTEVGRSYSDTTAVNVALAIRKLGMSPKHVRFWKEVDGVMSADPKDLNGENSPKRHDVVSLAEGLEMAAAGSGLMQVDALSLALANQLDLELRNIINPRSGIGTLFVHSENAAQSDFPLKAIISNENIDTLTLECGLMADKPGFIATISQAFHRRGISVDNVFTEGTSIGFSIPIPSTKNQADRDLKRRIINELADELKVLEVGGEVYNPKVTIKQNEANIALVGEELKGKIGLILASITVALNEVNIPITAISTGGDNRRISICVPEEKRKLAVQILHKILFDQKTQIIAA